MKRASRILLAAAAVPVILAGAAFLFLEGRLLLSGDWLLHQQPLLGFLQYLLRFALAGLAAFSGIRALTGRTALFESFCLTAMTAGISLFAVNQVGLYLFLTAAIFLAANLFRQKYAK